MQRLQHTLTSYYDEIPKDWGKNSAISFATGFVGHFFLSRNFNRAMRNGFYYGVAEMICQIALPLLKENEKVMVISQIAIKDFTILTGLTHDIRFGLKATFLTTSFKIVEFLLESHVSKAKLLLYSDFSSQFRSGIIYYQNHDSTLKSALITTGIKYLFEKNYLYIKSLSESNKSSPCAFDENFNKIERSIILLGLNSTNYLYGRPMYSYGLSISCIALLVPVVRIEKFMIKGIIKNITKRDVETFTKEEVEKYKKGLFNNPLEKFQEFMELHQKL